MAIALVQQSTAVLDPFNSTTSYVMASFPAAGSMLVVQGVGNLANVEVTSISGGGVTTWVKEIHVAAPNVGYVFSWYGLNASGASKTVSITRNGYNNNSIQTPVNVAEFSGIQTIETVVDGTPSSASGTHAPAASGTTTPTSGTSVLLLGNAGQQPAGNVFAGITSGFTAMSTTDGQFFAPAYQIVSSATGSYGFGWATGGFSSGAGYMNWGATIIAYKASGGAPANKGFFF